ncbi:MAG: NAD(P)/FAD-dependent oxidoreductase [Planctomycetota bacterium]
MNNVDTQGGDYDAIVIGGGHNGLIAAAYLVKAGKKVCVLERRHVLGGCSVTEELWPGYRVSTAAYVVSLLLPEIIRDLKLKENGLKVLPRKPSSFTPMRDGRHLLLGADPKQNHDQISKFSKRDADQFSRYEKLLEQVAVHLEPILNETSPDLLPLPKSWRKIGLGKKLRDAQKGWRLRSALAKMESSIPEGIELLTAAARPILERWFETEVLKATLATDAIIGAFASVSEPGTAYVLLHHVMGTAGGARGVWGYVEGGMGAIADATAKTCRELGVDIVTEAEVSSIDVAQNHVQGVSTTDGRTFTAKAVASTVDCNLTFNHFLQPDDLPSAYLAAVNRISYRSATLKVNLALGEAPDFTCLPGNRIGPQHNGTIHIGETIEEIERAFDDAKYGQPSKNPIVEVTIPTSVDQTISPEGKHIISMFVQYAPYELKGGLHWDEIKESFADRCIERLAEYAPNVPNVIEHRQVLSPLDLERVYGLTGGNIFQGAMNLNQLHMMRPLAGWSDHRTPIQGLYLCGAASHPGGGVMGACGKNGAGEMLRDGV